jgi:serine/threonine/tyrosine-interacting protein
MEPSPPCDFVESHLPHSSPPAQRSGVQSCAYSLSPGRSLPWTYESRRCAQQIIPGLWLGPFSCSSSGELSSHSGAWTHIIIRAAQERNHVKRLPLHPDSTIFFEFSSHHGLELLMPIFVPACDAILTALSSGTAVGVFCISGLSRAPAVAAAYLIAHCGMSAVDAIRCVSSQRSCVHFSDSMLRQLHEFELLQRSRVSVASFGGAASESSSRKRNDSAAHNAQPSQSLIDDL